MSADMLRRAAVLMRERVEAATGGPWKVSPWDDKLVLPKAWADEIGDPVERPPFVAIHSSGSAEHIASWHPAVALAVADWLDAEAAIEDEFDTSVFKPAIAVARAYLGEVKP